MLITQDMHFTGLEAKNLIYCSGGDQKDGFVSSVRCNMMRAVCNLVIIQLLQPRFKGFDFV